jgi:DNA-binding response OmpR family regulator
MSPDQATILIIEDAQDVLQITKETLQAEGYEVLTASTGKDAFQVLNHTSPSLVILDLTLPDMDGINICQRIRRTSRIPIIMVAGKSEIRDRVQGFNAGADYYLTKPFSYGELITRVADLLRRASNFDGLSNPPIFKYQDMEDKLFTEDFLPESQKKSNNNPNHR